jgi:hypothetical protein
MRSLLVLVALLASACASPLGPSLSVSVRVVSYHDPRFTIPGARVELCIAGKDSGPCTNATTDSKGLASFAVPSGSTVTITVTDSRTQAPPARVSGRALDGQVWTIHLREDN